MFLKGLILGNFIGATITIIVYSCIIVGSRDEKI